MSHLSGLLTARQFRPMRLSEIIDRAFELFRQEMLPLMTLSILGWGPLVSSLFGWLYFIYYNKEIWNTSAYIASVIPFIVLILVAFSWFIVVQGAQNYLIFSVLIGKPKTPPQALLHALRRFATLLLNGFLFFFFFFVGFIFYILPSLYVLMRFSLLFSIASLEDDKFYFQTLQRNNKILGEGSGSKLFGLFFIFFSFLILGWLNLILMRHLFVYVMRILLGIDLTYLNTLPYSTFSLFLLTLLFLIPLKNIAYTLAYIDGRVRYEGWDLQLRITELSQSSLSSSSHSINKEAL